MSDFRMPRFAENLPDNNNFITNVIEYPITRKILLKQPQIHFSMNPLMYPPIGIPQS